MKLRITRVDIFSVKVPYKYAIATSLGSSDSLNNVIVKVYTNEGVIGWGETAPKPAFSGENQSSVFYTLKNHLAPSVIDENPLQLNLLVEKMDKIVWGQTFAKTAIDFALHDVAAKLQNIPLYNLLGGKCRAKIPLAWTIGVKDVKEAIKEGEEAIKEGFNALKIKIGSGNPEEDVRRVQQVQEQLGEEVPIRVDANQGYSLEEAKKVISSLDEIGLQLIEQPIKRTDLSGMAHLVKSFHTPIMADESVFTPEDAFKVAVSRAADIVNIKPQKPGGLVRSKQVAAICKAANLSCFASSRMSSNIGSAAVTHFVASTANVGFEGEFIDGVLMAEDYLVEKPLEIEEGIVKVPTGVGIGVKVDEEKLNKFKLDSVTVKRGN